MALGDASGVSGGQRGAEPLSIDALESELTTLAGHLGAAMYRFLVLIEEFDRREGWGGWGVRSCAHWLNWKCGVGLVAAREKVRVAKALPGLPLISEAMRTGTLSYAKVRAMTRVATPQNESALLSIAHNGTASHVESVVRAYRRTDPDKERELALQQQDERGLHYYWDHDGCLVVQGRLPPEQGALLIKALEAADQVLRDRAPAEPTQNDSAEACPRAPQNDSAEACPVAERRSWRSRQADALSLMAETLLAHGAAPLAAGDRHLVHVHVDLEALREAGESTDGRCHIEDGPAIGAEVARRLACDGGVVALFEDGDGKTLDVGRKTRAIPPAIRRALESRDQGCRFPNCTNRRFTDGHHIEHWIAGGETKLGNLALLCRFHHRLVHEGGFTMRKHGERFLFVRPDGREVPDAIALAALGADAANTLPRNHGAGGLSIDARSIVPTWGGEAADYTYILTMLEQRDQRGMC